jgi:hypothetical protein
VEFRGRKQAFGAEVGRIKADMAQRGMLQSGWTVSALIQAVRQEYEIRARLTWQVLSRVLVGQPVQIDQTVSGDISAWINIWLTEECDDLELEHSFIVEKLGFGSPEALSQLRGDALDNVGSEIEISLFQAKRTQEETGSATVVNIYQPYGIVQTGTGSVANWSQDVQPDQRDALRRALDAVQKAASEAHALSPGERIQLLEVVTDTREEVQKEVPNMIKVRGAVSTLGATVQTLGSATAAYQLLKGAATLIGVNLP